MNALDPVAGPQETFDLFSEFVEEIIQSSGELSYANYIENVKSELRRTGGAGKHFTAGTRAALSNPSYFFRYLWRFVFANSACRHIAERWIQMSGSS